MLGYTELLLAFLLGPYGKLWTEFFSFTFMKTWKEENEDP